jgi:hypothetical protein
VQPAILVVPSLDLAQAAWMALLAHHIPSDGTGFGLLCGPPLEPIIQRGPPRNIDVQWNFPSVDSLLDIEPSSEVLHFRTLEQLRALSSPSADFCHFERVPISCVSECLSTVD